MKNTNKAFTLVELIVVITILAILGTIAFVSLQGYSQEAKNSKIITDINTLISSIETKLTDGTLKSLNSAIETVTGSTDKTGNEEDNYASGSYASGVTLDVDDAAANGTYNIGKINFTNLKQNGTDFKDSEDNNYIIAIAIKDKNAFYQIAGQTMNADGGYTAVVKGTYMQLGDKDVVGLISVNSGSTD
jgi:prepilin-type N-terminal cleavage/methylation domain-containing protein